MRLLVFGHSGQLASELRLAGDDTADEVISLGRDRTDITDFGQVDGAVRAYRPELVINAAAYTAVDRAETERDLAFAVNAGGAENIARACAKAAVPLVHVSTDYVFDGRKQGAWVETDAPHPLNAYGESKLEGERRVMVALPQHYILRVSWLFSETGTNFVKTMLRLFEEKGEVNVVNDQYGRPTSAKALAAVCLEIARRLKAGEALEWGIYHFANKPAGSWYEFACAINSHFGCGATVNPIPSEQYPTPANRPRNTVLSTEKLESSGFIIGNYSDYFWSR